MITVISMRSVPKLLKESSRANAEKDLLEMGKKPVHVSILCFVFYLNLDICSYLRKCYNFV
jgi:hypothetical protein